MSVVEGVGDDVTVVFLLFVGLLTFYFWKVCFRNIRNVDDEIPVEGDLTAETSSSADYSPVSESSRENEHWRASDASFTGNSNVENVRAAGDVSDESVEGTILVKLRHEETERVARIRPDQTVRQLKR